MRTLWRIANHSGTGPPVSHQPEPPGLDPEQPTWSKSVVQRALEEREAELTGQPLPPRAPTSALPQPQAPELLPGEVPGAQEGTHGTFTWVPPPGGRWPSLGPLESSQARTRTSLLGLRPCLLTQLFNFLGLYFTL